MNFILNLENYVLLILKVLISSIIFFNICESSEFNNKFDDHIIKFVRFYSNDERKNILKFSLQHFNNSWQYVLRPYNYVFYSDFEVIKIDKKYLADISNQLYSYKIVKSITRNSLFSDRKLHFFNNNKSKGHKISYYLQADMLWGMGIRGQGVRVGIFDTGIDEDHSHFKTARLIECTNWTNEPNSKDTIGHGTFVAGMLVSDPEDDRCPKGISPDVDLYIFRLFTKKQTSYTSWFLDAFNYAMAKKIHLINLSIGGPDFQDKPFVEKVWELSANGILMISAIGNDGPLYGTLNNPADQMDVIGVGGMDFTDKIARFSSRGMTTWEIPFGYGRVKPDVVTHGSQIVSSSLDGSCRSISGTSVASPSVAAAVALLICAANNFSKPNDPRTSPASIKQAILSGATRLTDSEANIFEQGMGKLNLIAAYRTLLESQPQASAYPSYIDFTETPYMWPYSSQPLYSSAMPIIINLTIINSMAVSGIFSPPPVYYAISSRNGEKIQVAISYSKILWPWTGYLALEITVPEAFATWEGVTEGYVIATIQSKIINNDKSLISTIKIPIKAKVVPTPLRRMRILWDQFHNLRYPPGYIPRDNIRRQEPLDWTGDHIHTNFKDTYDYLRNKGYYIEVLGSHYGCFNASNYGTLIIMDPEEEFFITEKNKLFTDVTENGLSLIVIAEWYNVKLMRYLRFFDENTRQWWTPDTGGANIPALNDLLAPFNIEFSDQVLDGTIKIGEKIVQYNSGTRLSRFPNSKIHISRVLYVDQLKDIGMELLKGVSTYVRDAAVLGLYSGSRIKKGNHGRISVYGDSNCLDMTFREKDCLWLLENLLQFSRTGLITEPLLSIVSTVKTDLGASKFKPKRYKDSRLFKFSSVIKSQLKEELIYRDLPNCTRQFTTEMKMDYVSIPDETWYRPQPLLKKGNYNAPFGTGFMNYSPYQSVNLDNRHPRVPRIVLQQPDLSGHRLYWLYLICVVSMCCIVLCFFCRRLRPRMKEIRPIFQLPNVFL